MRRFLRNTDGAISADWVVLVAALVGLGVAVLSTISTGTLDLAGNTSDAVQDQYVNLPEGPTVTADDGTNWFPWVARTETDEGGTWAYNSENQLIDYNTGDLLPILATVTLEGAPVTYYNQRGEEVDQNGVLIDPSAG